MKMTLPEFWDKCYGFNWNRYLYEEIGSTQLIELRKLAALLGPEYEQILNNFIKAYRFNEIVIPSRPT